MKTYTVYMPEHAADGNTTISARGPLAEFVKDGFSWPALFFGPLWLLWHWLWWELLGYIFVAPCWRLSSVGWMSTLLCRLPHRRSWHLVLR